jgi:4-alpha-glucanotransferase
MPSSSSGARAARLLHERMEGAGLKLYGDLQIGISAKDAWAYQGLFLDNYLMGAPPSRTNPEGQPWNYPVLDPARTSGRMGRARARRWTSWWCA